MAISRPAADGVCAAFLGVRESGEVTFTRHPGIYLYLYLYLCHILAHEDMGMMRNFRVT